uniref:Putative carboxypeptidase inhibitor n=1 Tax=Ixodes ricinus TaxID=34613 RepID=A0A6B0U392_IXORI
MVPSTFLLLLVPTCLLFELSQANSSVTSGYRCLPENSCPEEYRRDETGCEAVCCDLLNISQGTQKPVVQEVGRVSRKIERAMKRVRNNSHVRMG